MLVLGWRFFGQARCGLYLRPLLANCPSFADAEIMRESWLNDKR